MDREREREREEWGNEWRYKMLKKMSACKIFLSFIKEVVKELRNVFYRINRLMEQEGAINLLHNKGIFEKLILTRWKKLYKTSVSRVAQIYWLER